MKDIKIKNKKLKDRFDIIIKEYSIFLNKEDLELIEIVILRYKENSHNEYYIVLLLIYWFYFFKAISIDNSLVTEEDKINIDKIEKSFKADIWWNMDEYLKEMASYDDDLFLAKSIIKYTLLNSENTYLKLVPNLDNYYRSVWFLIPLLTFRESPFLSFYQDFYFKKMYPEEYSKLKKKHLKITSKLELPWEYIISKINTLSNLMKRINVSWTITLRKKSYFSLYAKYNNTNKNITDSFWIRIVFNSTKELNTFKEAFEFDHIYLNKKDYISKPKENWYKAIHYSYLTAFRTSQILVELQIKTKKMEEEMNKKKDLSHFTYTLSNKKWATLFKEVHDWYKITKNLLV